MYNRAYNRVCFLRVYRNSITEIFWLVEQGLYALIAYISLVISLFTMFMKLWINEKMNGDGIMKCKNCMIVCLEISFTLSTNIAGGALLAKVFQ